MYSVTCSLRSGHGGHSEIIRRFRPRCGSSSRADSAADKVLHGRLDPAKLSATDLSSHPTEITGVDRVGTHGFQGKEVKKLSPEERESPEVHVPPAWWSHPCSVRGTSQEPGARVHEGAQGHEQSKGDHRPNEWRLGIDREKWSSWEVQALVSAVWSPPKADVASDHLQSGHHSRWSNGAKDQWHV